VSSLALDGELAIFDAQLRSRSDWLRHRQPAELATPAVLIAFDLLYVKGREVSQRPLRERRARLEDLVGDADLVHAAWRLASHGLSAAMRGSSRRMRASVYVGGRTRDWLKVKQANWTEGEHRWRRRLPGDRTYPSPGSFAAR
jgi:bifunctional non-homologous end joining protein LigD